MIALKKAAGVFLRSNARVNYAFSRDPWKDRDDAAEKVYISQQERQSLKKLLKKVEEDEEEWRENTQLFQNDLEKLCKKYNIHDQTFIFEVTELHSNLSD